MVVSSDRPAKPDEKLPHKTFQVPYTPGFFEDKLIRPELEGNKYEIGWNFLNIQLVMCECLLNSSEILQELKSFDLIVFDSIAICGVLISELLNIPSVMIVIGPPNFFLSIYHMVPMPVSYVPQRVTGFPSKMTFMQRAINLVTYCASKVLLDLLLVRSMDALKAKFGINPERSYKDSYGDAELVIFVADFALEYPQPLLPGLLVI